MIGAEATGPVDRPNLSKDFLAGNAPLEWMVLRDKDFYREQQVQLLVNTRVVAMDLARRLTLDGGTTRPYGALVLATGADPVKLPVPGADSPHVFVLRTLADADAIIARSAGAKSATVIGAGFIGLEVAASLRGRGLDVHVVAPEAVPLARVMGDAIGGFVRTAGARRPVSPGAAVKYSSQPPSYRRLAARVGPRRRGVGSARKRRSRSAGIAFDGGTSLTSAYARARRTCGPPAT
jgi:NAD(P)H-nitrite reductase large subunit